MGYKARNSVRNKVKYLVNNALFDYSIYVETMKISVTGKNISEKRDFCRLAPINTPLIALMGNLLS